MQKKEKITQPLKMKTFNWIYYLKLTSILPKGNHLINYANY